MSFHVFWVAWTTFTLSLSLNKEGGACYSTSTNWYVFLNKKSLTNFCLLAMLEKNGKIGEKPSCFGMLLNGTIAMENCCKLWNTCHQLIIEWQSSVKVCWEAMRCMPPLD